MSFAGEVRVETLGAGPSVEAVIAGAARRRDPAVLDSADTGIGRGRYTIVACEPAEVASWRAGDGDPFEGMREGLRPAGVGTVRGCEELGGIPFGGGWIGYFAYEAGRWIERLPATTAADVGLPIARFGLYDHAAVHDAWSGRWSLVGVEWDEKSPWGRPRPLGPRFCGLRRLLDGSREPVETLAPLTAAPHETVSRGAYLRRVERAKAYIAAGDVFQVNLARRMTFRVSESSIETYLRLRRINPGAYAAYLRFDEEGISADHAGGRGDTALLSASPELYLRLRGREVMTRPIKGTRPRSDDAIVDAARRMELAASEKDRAELAMIVDLERNDLGRVCEYGTVRVESPAESAAHPFELETHPTVHHLAATVTGRLAPRCDAIDLVRATFPGGSITGAPKVRAMEIIDELEPVERSVYTGAIGWFGLDGSATFNIAIRTMIATGGKTHVYAGGGIVADSYPEAEYDETTAKALGMCRAVGWSPSGEPLLTEQWHPAGRTDGEMERWRD